MPRGGFRPGAGRKSNAAIQDVRALLDESVPTRDWKKLVRHLHALAMQGNVRAAQLLFSYRYGNPYAEPPVGEVIVHVVREPVRNLPPLTHPDYGATNDTAYDDEDYPN